MKLHDDLREFIGLLNDRKVECLVVGGHAVAYHGYPRYTGDIDFLIRPTVENGQRLVNVLNEFGFESLGVRAEDFVVPEKILQLGRPPHRIDVMTSIAGVEFEEAWQSRVEDKLDGLPVAFVGKAVLLKNKRATGGSKDLVDAEKIERRSLN